LVEIVVFAVCINSGTEFSQHGFGSNFEWLAGYVYVSYAGKLHVYMGLT
jgi:hypothetical protein